jgi:hypothetical protein
MQWTIAETETIGPGTGDKGNEGRIWKMPMSYRYWLQALTWTNTAGTNPCIRGATTAVRSKGTGDV